VVITAVFNSQDSFMEDISQRLSSSSSSSSWNGFFRWGIMKLILDRSTFCVCQEGDRERGRGNRVKKGIKL